jgi:transcriptional regulator with XRE-family HTH domain
MNFSGNQLKAARMLLELDQNALAKAVGVSINTLRTMEACGSELVGGFASTRDRVREALEAMGIEFLNGDTPGVLMQRKDHKSASVPKRRRTK